MAVTDEPKIEPFPVIRLCNVPKDERPDWLVEGLWGRQAVGVVGGHPKVGKTWMALEMAVAIASGKPCLDRFPVTDPGPVLVYCAEDGKQRIRARVEGLCHARRLDFSRLAVGWIDANGLALDRPGDQLRLDETIKRTRARAVVFDPLVRLHVGDENSSQEIRTLLSYLRGLQLEHGVAVLLVHHTRKAPSDEPGQALRGSGDIHAWGDSNLYIQKGRDGWTLTTEHRAQPSAAPIGVKLDGDPPRLCVVDHSVEDRVLTALAAGPTTRRALRDQLGVRAETLGEVLHTMATNRKIRLSEGQVSLA